MRDRSQIGLLWQEAAHQTDGILHTAAFIAVERFTEVRASAQDVIGAHMLCVLGSVVVSDGSSECRGIAAEPSGQRHAHGAGGFSFEFCQLGISGFALHTDLHGLVALAATDGICFPVADLAALEHPCRALLDRDSVRDMRFFVFPGVSSMFAPAMASDQERDEGGGLLVNPLINRLMANAEPRMFPCKSSCNQLWRPSQGKVCFHIASNEVGFEPSSPMGLPVALIRAFLGFVREIVAGVNGRGVSFELPAKGARAAV